MPDATLDQLNAFFLAAGALKPCPICDRQDWRANVASGESGVMTIALFLLRLGRVFDDNGRYSHQNTYLFYCGNCGFIRQHIAGVVDDWIANSKK